MAYPGLPTPPGATTWPGIAAVISGEADPPGLFAAPQGLSPKEALLVRFTPPTGKGGTVTRECPSDLQFDNTAPGGYGAMQCTIDWPLGDPPPDCLAIGSVAQVVDRRNGSIVWHGQVVDPGYLRTGTGASHQVSALGFHTILQTQAAAVAYIDRDLGHWTYAKDYPAGSAQVVDDVSLSVQPDDWVDPSPSILQMDIPEGSKLDASTPTHMTLQYLPCKYGTGVSDIVRFQGTHDGTNGANYRIYVRVVNSLNAYNTILNRDYTSSQHDFRLTQGAGTWATINGRVLQLRWEYDGSADAVASRDYFLRWGNLAVIYQMLDRTGANIAPLTSSIEVGDVVDDVIGRLLHTKLEISQDIAHPTALVEQAAWFEGITAEGIFDFLEDLAPDYYWAVWGPQARTLPRFEYRKWKVHPRYVLPPTMKLVLAGGGDELFNSALVSYQASGDVPASVVVTGDVAELAAAGQSRRMIVDLTGEGPLSKATAIRKGQAALDSAGLQRTSGTVTVDAPVYDVREGRMVEPWEIRSGWPIVHTGGVLRADGGLAYSPTGSRDGRSTFRLTQAQYSASTGAAELTLDGGGRNLFNRVRRPLPAVRRLTKRDAIRRVVRNVRNAYK